MQNVLYIGDVNVDLILGGLQSPPVIDREITCSTYTKTLGSTVVIAAANYVGLGGQASVAGLCGDDEYGSFMIEAMRQRGIDTSLVQRTSAVATGVTVVLVHGSTRTQITYPGAIAAFSDTSEIERNLERFTHLHFSGVYQQHGLRPKLAALMRRAHASGLSVSLDPQWDPTETWELLDEWLPLLDYFFVNRDEALSITKAASVTEAVAHLSGLTRQPVCKLGAQGCIVPTITGQHTISPYPVAVVDTTGAGDAFAAGFLYATIEKRLDIVTAARFANAAAARNCTVVGGVNDTPRYEEILRLMESYRD